MLLVCICLASILQACGRVALASLERKGWLLVGCDAGISNMAHLLHSVGVVPLEMNMMLFKQLHVGSIGSDGGGCSVTHQIQGRLPLCVCVLMVSLAGAGACTRQHIDVVCERCPVSVMPVCL